MYKALTALCLAAGTSLLFCGKAMGQLQQPSDTTSYELIDASVATAVRVGKTAPFAVANVEGTTMSRYASEATELPYLFSRTPGVIAYSDNGVGVGTTYLRIRGVGDSRINVTLDGVPLNSPEDQSVFWANMNSFANFLGSAQIQRGVGASTNGDGAFGGSVNLSSRSDILPYVKVGSSYGSYNTFKVGGNFSTGLIGRHFIIDGGYNTTSTDGYMHGTQGRSGSYSAGLTFLQRGWSLKYRYIGNFENTGQAWNGVDSADYLDGNYGQSTGINGYADLYKMGLGRYNSLCEYYTQNEDGSITFHPYPQVTTDNFWQNHHILSASFKPSDRWTGSAALHYTAGHGYYDEFRSNNKLSKFGLSSFTDSKGETVSRTDFVRKKGLTQDTYGLVASGVYDYDGLCLTLGLSLQQFRGNHYGYLTYVGHSELSQKILASGDYQYYDSDARKDDYSFFVRASKTFSSNLTAFGDIQYRHVDYTTDGYNDKFYKNADGSYSNQILDIDGHYNFVNPKAGLKYQNKDHSAYISFAIASREPERNNFTDNGSYPAPKPEHAYDVELGYGYDTRDLQLGANFYYMYYHNQFVQTGELSDIGEALTTNIERSFRSGVELSALWKAARWVSLEANAALSTNRVLDFDEVVEDWDDYDTGCRTIHYDNSPLAFSPSAILNGGVNFLWGGFRGTLMTSYVSRQYLDNTGSDQRSLPAYTHTDINLSYSIKPSKVIKDVTFGVNLGNIFNSHYASFGWVYSAICQSLGNPDSQRYRQIGYYPSAGFTALGSISLTF